MKTSTFTASTLLASAFGVASALPHKRSASAPPTPAQTANPAQISSAVIAWQSDTNVVSTFLNQAAALDFNSQSDYQSAAQSALEHEMNELTQKAVLDSELPPSSTISNANNILVNEGTFQSVVDLLTSLTSESIDESTGRANIQNFVNDINFGENGSNGRCQAVLPAINQYFSAASEVVSSVSGIQAVAPTACSSGPIQPVQASPAASSAAASK